MDQPRAFVDVVDGRPVLNDPDALAVIQAIQARNRTVSRGILREQVDRIKYFTGRVKEKGLAVNEVVIVIINVDSMGVGILVELLMPGQNWQSIRDKGQVPLARGLAPKVPVLEYAKMLYPNTNTTPEDELLVVHFDLDSVYIYTAKELLQ